VTGRQIGLLTAGMCAFAALVILVSAIALARIDAHAKPSVVNCAVPMPHVEMNK
jgi:hypothetical protein